MTDEEWERIKKKALENTELKKAAQAARGESAGNDIVALLLTGIAAVLYVGGLSPESYSKINLTVPPLCSASGLPHLSREL